MPERPAGLLINELWNPVFYRSREQIAGKVMQHISRTMDLVLDEISDEVWSHIPDALEPERFLDD